MAPTKKRYTYSVAHSDATDTVENMSTGLHGCFVFGNWFTINDRDGSFFREIKVTLSDAQSIALSRTLLLNGL